MTPQNLQQLYCACTPNSIIPLLILRSSTSSITWRSDPNVAAVTVLTKEVKSLNPTFQAGDIRGRVLCQYSIMLVIIAKFV